MSVCRVLAFLPVRQFSVYLLAVNIAVHLASCLHACLPACLSACPLVFLFVCLSVCLTSDCFLASLSAFVPACLSLSYLPVCLSDYTFLTVLLSPHTIVAVKVFIHSYIY